MTVGTVNPTAFTVSQGSWSAFTGSTAYTMAASAVAAVSDSSNNTYVRATALPAGSYGVLSYDVADVTVGGSAITRLRVGMTLKNGAGSGVFIGLYAGTTSTDNLITLAYYAPTGTTAATVYTGWLARATPFSTATANTAIAYTNVWDTALRFTKIWMEYDLASVPTGTPSVSAVNTDRPTITWTFADGDGYVQSSAVVKVFSSAQYSAAGFSASTSTPLWSGTVNGTAASISPSTAIVTNGLIYKPFLQVYKDVPPTAVPSASFASAAAPSTANFTAPNAPTVTTTWSSALSRVQIQAVGALTPNRIVIFRGTSLTDANYTLLKDSTQTDGTATAYDYFVPRGTPVVYGAWVNTGTVTPYLSSTATMSTVTTGSATGWELRSVNAPTTYYNLAVPVTGINFDIYEGQTVFRPLGSSYPVVASGDLGGDDGTVTITTTNQTTWDNIKAMLELQSDLYLVAPFVDSNNLARRWFIRVTGRSWAESGIPSAQVRTAQVSFVEVQPPAVAAE